MKHAILGAGGVGGVIGGVLVAEGDSVVLLLREAALADHPHELLVERPNGALRVPVELATKLEHPVDVLWISVKATQLEAALAAIVVPPAEIGAVVPLLNGIDHVALLRARFGDERVVPATIRIEAERIAPGHIAQHSVFAHIEFAASGKERLGATVAHLNAGVITTSFEENETTLLWSKLSVLAPLALTTAASGLTKGGIFDQPLWLERLETAVNETRAVGLAEGANLPARPFLEIYAIVPPPFQSSMLRDVAAGRRPELDAIAGPILRAGDKHGLNIDTIRELASMIAEKGATPA